MDNFKVTAAFARLQPGEERWSDDFWVGGRVPGSVDVSATVRGDNIPVPLACSFEFAFETEDVYVSDEELVAEFSNDRE
jgi:hypothetical protein